MESTVKLRIGKYLLTGVIFGGVTFKLGEETGVDIAERTFFCLTESLERRSQLVVLR